MDSEPAELEAEISLIDDPLATAETIGFQLALNTIFIFSICRQARTREEEVIECTRVRREEIE